MTYTTSSDTEYYAPLNFENLDDNGGPDFNKTVVSIKADGRAWAYKKGKNFWYLIDLSILNFYGIDPVEAKTENAEVTYYLDLDNLTRIS